MSNQRTVGTPAGTARATGRLGLVQVGLAGVLWGSGGFTVQLIRRHDDLSVLTISGYRVAIATLALLAVVALGRQLGDVRTALREHPVATVVMGLSTAAYQVLYFSAVVWVGVSVATVVSLGIAPLLITAWDSLRTRRWPHPAQALVLLVALTGLLLVTVSTGGPSGSGGPGNTGNPMYAPHPTLGVLAAVASGTGYAVATVLGHRLAQHTNPLALTTAATAVGALALVPLGLASGVTGWGGTVLLPTSGVVVVLLVYLGVLTMALAYWLLYAGLRTTPGSSAVVATLLEPVTAAALAVAFLGERLGLAGLLGAVLVLGAVVGLHRTPTLEAVPPG